MHRPHLSCLCRCPPPAPRQTFAGRGRKAPSILQRSTNLLPATSTLLPEDKESSEEEQDSEEDIPSPRSSPRPPRFQSIPLPSTKSSYPPSPQTPFVTPPPGPTLQRIFLLRATPSSFSPLHPLPLLPFTLTTPKVFPPLAHHATVSSPSRLSPPTPCLTPYPSPSRRRYKLQAERKQLRHRESILVTNLSSLTLTETQDSLLSRGLNFCPDPEKVNRTEMEARYARLSRVTRWREFCHGKHEGEKTGPKKIFKEIKTNYPPGVYP